jgi:signal transduction histidine kinase
VKVSRLIALLLLAAPVVGVSQGAAPDAAAAARLEAQLASYVQQTRLAALLQVTSEDLLGLDELRATIETLRARQQDGQSVFDRALVAVLDCRYQFRKAVNVDAARTRCAEAVELARRAGQPTLLLSALRVEGLRRSDAGDPAEAVTLLRESLRLAETVRDDYAIAVALNSLGIVADNVGAVKESTQYYLAALRHALRAGAVGFAAIVETNIGLLYYFSRDHAAALDWLQRARGRALRVGNTRLVYVIDNARAGSLAGQGRLDEARSLLQQVLRMPRQEIEPKFRSNVHRASADVALRAGDWAAAERHARDGIAAAADFPYRNASMHVPLIAALRGAGRRDEALRVTDELLRLSQRFPTLNTDALAARAELLADGGDHAAAYGVMREVEQRRAQATIGAIPQQAQFMRAQLQADLLDRPLAQSERRAASSERDAARANRIRDAAFAFTALSIIVGLLLWRIRDERRGRQVQQELRATIELKTRDLEAAMLERRQLERELDRRDRLEAIGRLAGGIAHDFNNLMTIVLQCSELLARRAKLRDDRDARDLLDECVRAARTGGEISQQLVAFARQQSLSPAVHGFGEFLAGARPLLERAAGEERRFEFDLPENPPRVALDAGSFTAALINLVINARDATSEGGRIAVRVRRVDPTGQLAQRLSLAPGNWVEVAVIDDGRGMPEAVAARAVEPFFSTKHESAGAGLGLSMAHGLAVQLGGDLIVDSEAGSGTTIRILLPEAEAAGAAAHQLVLAGSRK